MCRNTYSCSIGLHLLALLDDITSLSCGRGEETPLTRLSSFSLKLNNCAEGNLPVNLSFLVGLANSGQLDTSVSKETYENWSLYIIYSLTILSLSLSPSLPLSLSGASSVDKLVMTLIMCVLYNILCCSTSRFVCQHTQYNTVLLYTVCVLNMLSGFSRHCSCLT